MTTTSKTTAADTRKANQVLSALVSAEADSAISPDGRRVLRHEADTLRAAIASERHDHPKHDGDRAALEAAVTEARRVAAMWGVTV